MGQEGVRILWPSMALIFLSFLALSSLSACLSSSPPAAAAAESSSADRLALLSFKSRILSDPSGALASWNDTLHFCRWQGVRFRTRRGEPRVAALNLAFLGLAGELSPSLSNLTFLRRLNVSHNNLQGPIPAEIGLLSRLRLLELSRNPLGGTIPSSLFLDCSRLRILRLRGNNLSGKIPRNLSNCSNLQHIDLTNNMLEGQIPRDLCSLAKLEDLELYNNSLTGSIPPEIGNLSSLIALLLTSNNLSGSIPSSIGNLSSVVVIDLHNNSLTGEIPSSIGNLAHLTFLGLHINLLSGSIPSEIGDLANLSALFLGANRLTGVIPRSMGRLQNLRAVILSYNGLEARNAEEWGFVDAMSNCSNLFWLDVLSNKLGGELPRSIGNLSKNLGFLYLEVNQITGSIPVEIGSLTNLMEIKMRSNLLGGFLPATLGRLRKLVKIDLSRNYLTGEIPPSLGNLTELNELHLDFNQLHGSIPPGLSNCYLNNLTLSFNKLSGRLPKEILSMSTLTKSLDVSYNSLTGSLPSEIGKLINIQCIDVSNNKFSGEIPSSLGDCKVLQYLYMQRNFFRGSIPPSFSQLKGLEVLDVSSNNLSGPIPDFLQSFHSMTFLNLSYNNFDGKVPTENALFSNSSALSVMGNNNLCGGVPELHLPSCSSRKKHFPRKLIVIISIAGGILCIIVLISLFATRSSLCKSRRVSFDEASSIEEKHRKVSFGELSRATNGFSPANLIGIGSFGSVYKGAMHWEDYKDVAVKVLNLQQKGASRSFMAECEALRNIRHRNLVKILTSCSSLDFQGNDFKALVFEFLPNGNLDKWLHPEVDEQDTSSMLSLIQRLNISIDVASSLVYLHHHAPNPLVHCDLKPSNVLLDCDMVAHVGDFGLARFLHNIVSTSLERSSNSSTLKGSIGYTAPEYGMGNKVSTKGDVYGYGILLLELFTGKRPTDATFSEGVNLHKYVAMALPDKIIEVTDPCLLLYVEEGEAQGTNLSTNEASMRALECITSVLNVGTLCSKESPQERMQMEDVIRELQGIRDVYLGSNPLQQ